MDVSTTSITFDVAGVGSGAFVDSLFAPSVVFVFFFFFLSFPSLLPADADPDPDAEIMASSSMARFLPLDLTGTSKAGGADFNLVGWGWANIESMSVTDALLSAAGLPLPNVFDFDADDPDLSLDDDAVGIEGGMTLMVCGMMEW